MRTTSRLSPFKVAEKVILGLFMVLCVLVLLASMFGLMRFRLWSIWL